MVKSAALIVCVLSLFALSAAAQDKPATQPTPAEWHAKIQADKKGLVERGMKLSPQEAAKFWPLYEKFQRELEVPQRQYALAVKDFVATEASISDANAKRLSEQVLAASIAEAQLRQKHFKQLSGVLPAKKAARYMQIENKIQAVLRYELAAAIPLAQ